MKTLAKLDLKSVALVGNVLDIGRENHGIIYRLCMEQQDEIAVDYVFENRRLGLEKKGYNTAALFFTIGEFHSRWSAARFIKYVSTFLDENGELVIWDINKKYIKLVDMELMVVLPGDSCKFVKIKNKRLFFSMNLSKLKKILGKSFDIIEESSFEHYIFLRARKRRTFNESSISSNKCEVCPYKYSGKVP